MRCARSHEPHATPDACRRRPVGRAYCYKGIPQPLWLNIRWGALYVAINVVQLYLLYSDSRAVQLDPEMRELYATHFEPHAVTTAQFAKMMATATSKSFGAGTPLVAEGARASELLLLVRGSATQHKDGLQVGSGDSTFIGPIAFLDDSQPTYPSTWVTTGPAAAYVWDAEELKALLARNPELGISVRGMLRSSLVERVTSSLASAHLTAYAYIIAGVTGDGAVSPQEQRFCAEFRKKYSITEAQHADALQAMGWTPAAFEKGER